MSDHQHRAPSPLAAGLGGRCPRCGEGKLFAGFLTIDKSCSVCDLDFGFADSGDGPAFFVIFAVGFIVVALALVTDVLFNPPTYVHLALWLPATLVLSLLLLRPFKAIMVALQYRHVARGGRSD